MQGVAEIAGSQIYFLVSPSPKKTETMEATAYGLQLYVFLPLRRLFSNIGVEVSPHLTGRWSEEPLFTREPEYVSEL